MNILYCGDANIARGVLISSLSLAQHTEGPINVYILTASIACGERSFSALPADFAELLAPELQKAAKASSVRIFDMTDSFNATPPLANLNTRFTPCCMLRLYADLLPSLPRHILYLDNDTVFLDSPDELFATDMGDAYIAGIPDYYGRWICHGRTSELYRHDYLNSGVLLMDLKRIHDDDIFARARALCAEKRMFLPDQDAINRVADKRIVLPRRFNEQRKTQHDTVIRHFSTTFRLFPVPHAVSVKPWQKSELHDRLGIYEFDDLIDRAIGLQNKPEDD